MVGIKGKSGVYKHEARSLKTKEKISKTQKEKAPKGENSLLWKGGKTINTDGYILIHKPNHPNKNAGNYIAKHRLVMEKNLGRYLTKEEQIHHLDGDKTNNNIDNLHLFKTNKEHVDYHWFLRNLVKEVIKCRL